VKENHQKLGASAPAREGKAIPHSAAKQLRRPGVSKRKYKCCRQNYLRLGFIMASGSAPQTGALERFLLDNAMHMECGSAGDETVDWAQWLRRYWTGIVAALVAAGTLLVMHHWRLYGGFGHSVSEAVFLAAALTATVDPFLKRRLAEDAAKGIFHHLLGIDFPVEIRDQFQRALFGVEIYSTGVEIEVRAVQLADQGRVTLEVTTRSTIVAAKTNAEYQQTWAFEEAENATMLQASITSNSDPSISYSEENPLLASKPDDPEVLAWMGKKIKLSKGEQLSTYAKYRMTRPVFDFLTHNFMVPTIGARVRLEPSDDVVLSATTADQHVGNEYNYRNGLSISLS
jgi:hypothetical protein